MVSNKLSLSGLCIECSTKVVSAHVVRTKSCVVLLTSLRFVDQSFHLLVFPKHDHWHCRDGLTTGTVGVPWAS